MRSIIRLMAVIPLITFISACRQGGAAETAGTPTIEITPTPDPCNGTNLPAEVERVNRHMREFDDYAALASNTPQSQLVLVIPELQRDLREAEDQEVPMCLGNLKKFQIDHMQVVVQTLLAFVGNSDANLVNQGIAKARELHAQYDIEMARLMGIPLTIPSSIPATRTVPPPTSTLAALVTNPGPNDLNLRNAPDFNAHASAILAAGASTVALGRTTDSQWILVKIPDQPDKSAWVYSTVIQLSIPIESLPVTTP